jgi:hypothetical protein
VNSPMMGGFLCLNFSKRLGCSLFITYCRWSNAKALLLLEFSTCSIDDRVPRCCPSSWLSCFPSAVPSESCLSFRIRF